MADAPCSVCGWQKAVVKGRCRACDAYRRRTGRDRSEALVVAHGRRILERRLEARAWGRLRTPRG